MRTFLPGEAGYHSHYRQEFSSSRKNSFLSQKIALSLSLSVQALVQVQEN